MSTRRRYLITYDVSDDRRRNRIFNSLKDHGNHAQFSVFFCELSRQELARLRGDLKEHVHHHEDQVLILDLGLASQDLLDDLECLGRAYYPPIRAQIV